MLIPNVGINPTRTGLINVLAAMGAAPGIESGREMCGEPVADIVTTSGRTLHATRVSGELIPRMIDEFPIFAVAATQAHGETVVCDAAELRVKESDRISALTAELRKMGALIGNSRMGSSFRGQHL
jgi:3-phosphoshikimate 1-carboxyvinyltransferase